MGVGDHITVSRHDDAGAHGGAVIPLIGHHHHHGGVHPGKDLRGRQLVAEGVQHRHPQRGVVAVHFGNGGVVVGVDIRDAAGVVAAVASAAVTVIDGAVRPAAQQRGKDQHHRQSAHNAQKDPQAAALFLLGHGLLGRCGADAFRKRLAVHVVIYHLVPLPGRIPAYHLLWFVSISQFIHVLFPFRCCGVKSIAA